MAVENFSMQVQGYICANFQPTGQPRLTQQVQGYNLYLGIFKLQDAEFHDINVHCSPPINT